MTTNALNRIYNLKLSLADVITMIKDFRIEDKILIEKEIEKETLPYRARQLDKRTKSNSISMEDIVEEVRAIRKAKQ
jgi:hypothetical protein